MLNLVHYIPLILVPGIICQHHHPKSQILPKSCLFKASANTAIMVLVIQYCCICQILSELVSPYFPIFLYPNKPPPGCINTCPRLIYFETFLVVLQLESMSYDHFLYTMKGRAICSISCLLLLPLHMTFTILR